MNFTQLQQFIPYVNFVGIIALGTIVFFSSRKKELDALSNEIINTYRIRIEQLVEENKQCTIRQNDMTKEIGHIQGVLSEKEKEITRIRTILENRNPEMDGFMKLVGGVAIEAQGRMKANQEETKELISFMKSINTQMQLLNGKK